MNYCINPKCLYRQNPDNLAACQSCHTPLLVNNRYRLIKPLRELDEFSPTDIFEVDDGGTLKVLKVLKRPKLSPMFQREARVLQQLRHPGIPKVEPDGYFTVYPSNCSKVLHCLVMEKIAGENLEEWGKLSGKLSQKIAIEWLEQLTDILNIIHENNLFHRDIKPSNIMLRPDGQLVLIDFGTVREVTGTYLAKVGSDRQITGIISPGYTPQEQATGKAVPQSDFFALGRTLVHLLTEKHPLDLPENSKTGELIWLQNAPQISPALADLIDEMMAPFPGKRPASARVILQRLEMAKHNRGEAVKPPWLLTGMMLIWLGMMGLEGLRNAVAAYYYNRGLEYHLARQSGEAEAYYKRSLQLNPKYAEVYNALGFLCQQRQDIDCARRDYEKAIALQPSLAIAHFNLGVVCEEQQDWECAKIAYRQARKSLPAASNNLARLQILNKEYEKAAELLSEALKHAKEQRAKYAVFKNWGWALLGQKRYREAAEKLKSAIAIEEKSAPAYCLLAQVWEGEGKSQAAQVEWKNCIRYASRYNPDEAAWIDMARDRLNAGGEEK